MDRPRSRDRGGRRGGRGGVNKKRDGDTTAENKAEAKPTGPPDLLTTSGCKNSTVSNIVKGEFTKHSENHGKPVFKKTTQVNGLDVMVYFWEDKENANFTGWWFGPKVGGDQVWAYHAEKAMCPPANGWKVPYDGDVDNTFSITARHSSTASSGPSKAPSDRKDRKEEKKPVGQHVKEEDKRKKDAEDKVKQMEEQKRLLEDLRKKNEEEMKRRSEDAKRREEEDAKFRDIDAKVKKEVEDKRRTEQKSTLAIRRVIQKVRGAAPDTIDDLQKELEEVMAAELENCGSQKQRMQEESDKGLEQARARIEQLNLAKRKEGEKKEEDEKRLREAVATAKKLIEELTALVEVAETAASKLRETAAPLEASDSQLSVADVERVAQAVEDAGINSRASTKASTDFILQRGPEMKDQGPAIPGQPTETKMALARLLQRINECTRTSEAAITTARSVKDTAVRRADARDRTKEMEATFAKHDRDRDGVLSQKEVLNFAKVEYKFTIDEDTITRIMRNMSEDDLKGVPFDRFQWLRATVGTAREHERDVQRRREREAQESRLEEMKVALQARIQDAGKTVDDADKAVSAAEAKVQPLHLKSKSLGATTMMELSGEIDELIKAAKAMAAAARRDLDAATSENLDERFEAELKAHAAIEAKQLELRVGRMDTRISRATNLSSRFRDQANKKNMVELDNLSSLAVKVARYNQRIRNFTQDELFAAFDTNGDGEISKGEFVAFFEGADKELRDLDYRENLKVSADDQAVGEPSAAEGGASASSSPPPAVEHPLLLSAELPAADVARVFAKLLEEGEASLTREAFDRFTRIYYKVAKETALTDLRSVKSSTAKRRLEVNEVLEVLEGPVREDTQDLLRVRCKACSDGLEGWATVAGNQGTVFLREGGSLFKVVKETILTESFSLSGDKDTKRRLKDVTRKVKEGEVLEVWEWPRTEPTTGLIRMRCKLKSDGAVGWLTTTGNQGAVFAELL